MKKGTDDEAFDALLKGRMKLNGPPSHSSAISAAEAMKNTKRSQEEDGAKTSVPFEMNISELKPFSLQEAIPFDEKFITDLMESIREDGLSSPVVVRPLGSEYEILAGHHRVEACKRLGMQRVLVSVQNVSDASAARLVIADNSVRRVFSDFQKFKFLNFLETKGFVKTGVQAASVLGVSSSKITQLKAFSSFPQTILEYIADNPSVLGADAAYVLIDIAQESPELFCKALESVKKGEITQSGIRQWVEINSVKGQAPLYERKSIWTKTVEIKSNSLKKPLRIQVGSKGVKILSTEINADLLSRLIQDHLSELLLEEPRDE